MRKIGAEYENFIDNYLIDICEYMSSYIHKLGITPNIITTMSLICGLSASALLYNKHYYSACVLWIISYYLDNLDGYIARKYNQTSKIGDYYDHIADLIKFLTALFVLYKLNSHKFYEVSIVLFIFLIISGDNFTRRFIGTGKKITDNHRVGSGCQSLDNIAGVFGAAVTEKSPAKLLSSFKTFHNGCDLRYSATGHVAGGTSGSRTDTNLYAISSGGKQIFGGGAGGHMSGNNFHFRK